MKKYIREMFDDLNRKRNKDFVPAIPAASSKPPTIDLNELPAAAVSGDLKNQELSNDPAERVKQLDFQAQENEERQSS